MIKMIFMINIGKWIFEYSVDSYVCFMINMKMKMNGLVSAERLVKRIKSGFELKCNIITIKHRIMDTQIYFPHQHKMWWKVLFSSKKVCLSVSVISQKLTLGFSWNLDCRCISLAGWLSSGTNPKWRFARNVQKSPFRTVAL